MITVYGRKTSSNVQAAMWCITELGLEHRRHDYGGRFGKVDDPEYRAMNPNGLVPVIRDGDLVLWESAAIVRYLAAQYGDEAFWPSDPAKRARLDMWAEWAKTTVYSQLMPVVFTQLVRMRDEERNHAALSAGINRLNQLMSILNGRLEGEDFLGGKTLCFADIAVGHLLYRYYTLPIERGNAPAVDAYYARLEERPAYREHVMVSYEELRAS